MHRYKIELVTMNDIREFVDIVSAFPGEIRLTDGRGLCVNAKSVLGAVATVEWQSLYCQSECEIGEAIEKFCRDDADENQLRMRFGDDA